MQIVNDKPDQELQSVGLTSCPADLHVWVCSVMSDSCDCMDYSSPGSSVHGLLQARILEWVAMPSSPPGDLPDPGIKPSSLALTGGFFTTTATWETPIYI